MAKEKPLAMCIHDHTYNKVGITSNDKQVHFVINIFDQTEKSCSVIV